jgi:predicted nucleic acid-binding protein
VKPLFDTNILIDFLGGFPQAAAELDRYPDGAVSVVSWIEVLAGGPPEKQKLSRVLLKDFERIDLDDAIVERAVELRRDTRLRLPDAIILATAQTRGRLLVTRNTKDFPEGDPGVRVPYRI